MNINTGHGGGSHDSNNGQHQSRYSDSNTQDHESRSRSEPDEIKTKIAPKVTKPSSTGTTTTGKLKVQIKKQTSEVTANNPMPSTSKPAVEVDLFTFEPDVMSTPPSTAAVSFDPFNTASVPSPVQTASFDPFSSPVPVPHQPPIAQSAPNFDPFVSSSLPNSQSHQSHPVSSFDPFSSSSQVPVPVQQTSAEFHPFGAASQYQAPPPMQQGNGMAAGHYQAPPMHNTMTMHHTTIDPFVQQSAQNNFPLAGNYPMQAPIQSYVAPVHNSMSNISKPNAVISVNATNEFGDFETHNSATSNITPKSNINSNSNSSQWGNLVDLSGIAKNENKTSSAGSVPYSDSSFKGLDGFSKGSPSMVSIFENSTNKLNLFLIGCWLRCRMLGPEDTLLQEACTAVNSLSR